VSQTVAARKLDFMAIRFEVTKLLEPQDLTLEIESNAAPSVEAPRQDTDGDVY
jgi:hypothetical protein